MSGRDGEEADVGDVVGCGDCPGADDACLPGGFLPGGKRFWPCGCGEKLFGDCCGEVGVEAPGLGVEAPGGRNGALPAGEDDDGGKDVDGGCAPALIAGNTICP